MVNRRSPAEDVYWPSESPPVSPAGGEGRDFHGISQAKDAFEKRYATRKASSKRSTGDDQKRAGLWKQAIAQPGLLALRKIGASCAPSA
jgi:hypothetical protein